MNAVALRKDEFVGTEADVMEGGGSLLPETEAETNAENAAKPERALPFGIKLPAGRAAEAGSSRDLSAWWREDVRSFLQRDDPAAEQRDLEPGTEPDGPSPWHRMLIMEEDAWVDVLEVPERIDSCDAEVGRRLRPGPARRPDDAVGREAEDGRCGRFKFGALAEREGPADCGRRIARRPGVAQSWTPTACNRLACAENCDGCF